LALAAAQPFAQEDTCTKRERETYIYMSKDNKSFEVLASTHFSLFSRVLAAAAAGKERLQQQQEGSSTARNKLGKIIKDY
jgi:hypothetical protein